MAKEEYEKYAKVKEEETIKENEHKGKHPLFRGTEAYNLVIDKKNKRAAFILQEHIDTDRITEGDRGSRGDQYRYSVWVIEGKKKPEMVFSDTEWISPYTPNMSLNQQYEIAKSRAPSAEIDELKLAEEGILIKSDKAGLVKIKFKKK